MSDTAVTYWTLELSTIPRGRAMARFTELPVELKNRILSFVDPPSFSAMQLVCRTIRPTICQSTHLIRQRLLQVPGRRTGQTFPDALSLLRFYNQRAGQHLKHHVTCSSSILLQDLAQVAKSAQPSLKLCYVCDEPHIVAVTIDTDSPTVLIYHGKDDKLSLAKTAKPPSGLFNDAVDTDIEIIAVQLFDDGGHWCPAEVLVIYRKRHQVNETRNQMELVIFSFLDEFPDGFPHTCIDLGHLMMGSVPTAFYAHKTDQLAMISWESTKLQEELPPYRTECWSLDDRLEKPRYRYLGNKYDDRKVVGFRHIPESNFAFLYAATTDVQDSSLCYFWTPEYEQLRVLGGPNFGEFWNLRLTRPNANVQLPGSGRAVTSRILAQANFTFDRNEEQDGEGPPYYTDAYLYMAIERPNDEGLPMAFLMKACNPGVEEERSNIPLFQQTSRVALLAGLNIDSIPTRGLPRAQSLSGRRIAIAEWKRVLIWAIEPHAFLNARATGGFWNPDQFYQCGYDYYRCCSPRENGMVVIEAIELEMRGVVSSLEFRGDDELWGWTDRGLVRWDIDV